MSLADKFEYLIGTKTAIRDALNESGARIDESLPFRQYAGWVDWLNYSRANVLRNLYSSGETGTLASDLPYFVDVDGETEATWGDPVGLIRDASPNRADFTQPTVTARPILGRVPRGGRRNLVVTSSEVGSPNSSGGGATTVSTGWTLFDNALLQGRRIPPSDGVTLSWSYYQTTPPPVGTYRFSIYVRNEDGSPIVFGSPTVEDSNLNPFTVAVWGIAIAPNQLTIEELPDGIYRLSGTVTVSSDSVRGWGILRRPTHNLSAPAVIASGWQIESGSVTTPYQHVTSPYDITEAGVEDIHYLSFDLTDDNLTTTLPAIENGTVVIAGTNGIWIDDDYNFDGGTFSIGPTSYTNGPEGILEVIGDPIAEGFFVIDRQLSSSERARVITRMKQLGAPGVFELGPELWVSPSLGVGWSDNGDGSYTLAGDGSYSPIQQSGTGTTSDDLLLGRFNYVTTGPLSFRRNNSVTDAGGSTYGLQGVHFTTLKGSSDIGIGRVHGGSIVDATVSNISVRKLELIP